MQLKKTNCAAPLNCPGSGISCCLKVAFMQDSLHLALPHWPQGRTAALQVTELVTHTEHLGARMS